MKIVAQETKLTDSTTETENAKAGWFTKFSNWLRGRGAATTAGAATVNEATPPPPKEVRLLPFYVHVRHPKAGLVKYFVKAESLKAAQDQALVEYVRALVTTVHPYDK